MRDKTSLHAGRRLSPNMADQAKSRYQLVRELTAARRRIAKLEAASLKNARIQATQHQVLESIARGKPLNQALAALVRTVEGQCPGVMASVLLLDDDGEHLRHGAAPGLPEAYNMAIDGVRIGPSVGSCGTAAYRGERVIVSDIASDPLWNEFRDVALSHNLRACWSQPIFSAKHEILGTIAMYYSRPQIPTEADHDYIEVAAFLAGIAIERTRAEQGRQSSEQKRIRQTEELIQLAKSDAVVKGDLRAFLQEATRVAARLLDVERVSVWLFGDQRRALRCRQLFELTPDRHSSGQELQAADYPCYFAALESGRTVAADDAHTNEATREFSPDYLTPEGINSMLDAPIRRGAEVVGVFCNEHVGPRRNWTDEERELAATLADFVARELEAHERRQAEAGLRSAQEALLRQQWQATQQVEGQLNRAKDELVRQTRLATVGQVAASIAHELRNPLEAIDKSEYYLSRHVPEGQTRWVKYLDIIRQEVRAADGIVSDLLEASTAKVPLKHAVPLAESVREAFGRVKGTDAVRLRLDVKPDPFMVHADAGQLRQVLSNLMANAVDSMDGDGLIFVQARRVDGFDQITLSDDGAGIAAEIGDRVFEPLFTTKAKGTGLGLSICRQIVEAHGGTIEVANPQQGGAAFVVRVPSAVNTPKGR